MFIRRRHLSSVLLLATVGLTACGSSATHHSSSGTTTAATDPQTTATVSVPSDVPPGKVVAKVGGVPITESALAHQLVVTSAGKPMPDPPSYSACVTRAKGASGASADASKLKAGCEHEYEQLRDVALGVLIHNQWLIGEAAELGVHVSDAEALHEFKLSEKSSFNTPAEFISYLKKTGRTSDDVLLELKIGKLTDGIFADIKRGEHAATPGEVEQYYGSHKQKFAQPAGRDLHIVRTTTLAGAMTAKHAIESGHSFASVAKGLTAIAQPVGSKNGLKLGLEPHFYSEKPLNDAIFAAPVGKISGPVFVAKPKVLASEPASGYFVFEVIKTTPAHQVPLSEVRAELAKVMTETNKNARLAGFIKAFRQKWIAKTDCSPGYVVSLCQQSKSRSEPVDRYTL